MNSFSTIFLIFLFSNSWSQTIKPILKKYPKEIQKIIGVEKSVFRGSEFGDQVTNIKSKETVTLQGETDSSLIYTMYMDSDNSVDFIYYLDSTGKATGFALIFILQDVNEEKNLKTNLIKYYNERFGTFTIVNEEDELWTNNDGYFVEMKDTSDEAGMEIEIEYYKK